MEKNMKPSFITQIEKGDKNSSIMKNIISYYVNNSTSTIPDLAKDLGLSAPTVTKMVNEMCEGGLLTDHGKVEGHWGRRPVLYGFNPDSGYFFGVDVKRTYVNLGVINFMGEFVALEMGLPLAMADFSSDQAIEEICVIIKDFMNEITVPKDKIYYGCIALSGRVNPDTGFSYSTLPLSERPLNDLFAEKLGLPVCIDNDTRAMTYGDCLSGKVVKGAKNILFINMSLGLGMGMVINGNIVKGKSGYSGEVGHFPAFDNEIMCHCGKKGCLETEISGGALKRRVVQSLLDGKKSVLSDKISKKGADAITLSDIISAIEEEDMLCIEVLENIAGELGKWLAGFINIFNPELVIIGGTLAQTGDYLIRPIKQAVQKYTLKLVSQDSKIIVSRLGEKAGVLGAALTARNKILFDNN